MSNKFDLKEFATGNNVTYISLNEGDFVYIEMEKPENLTAEKLEELRLNARKFFDWVFKDTKIKHAVEYTPLKFTIITKKEEFVARLNDDIIQL